MSWLIALGMVILNFLIIFLIGVGIVGVLEFTRRFGKNFPEILLLICCVVAILWGFSALVVSTHNDVIRYQQQNRIN